MQPNAIGVTTTEPMYQYNFILKDTQPTDNRLLHLYAYRKTIKLKTKGEATIYSHN